MKNPVTYSVSDAGNLRRKRRKRNIIIVIGFLAVVLISLLVLYVSKQKESIDQAFPTTSSIEIPEASSTLTTDTSPSESESAVSTVDTSETALDTGTEDTPTEPAEINTYIPENTYLQEANHQERDSLNHALRTDLENLINSKNNSRATFFYINLENTESFGLDDRSPFVPAGVMNFPICYILFTQFENGSLSPTAEIPLEAADLSGGSSVFQEENIGTAYSLRTYVSHAIKDSDNASTSVILRQLGGIEAVNIRLQEISNFVNFRADSRYTDYAGVHQTGKGRISSQDLALYMQAFYQKYLISPEVYQPLFNDLTSTISTWGAASAVSAEWVKGEKTGENTAFGAYSSLSLVFAQEPYILCIMTEAPNYIDGKTLQWEISELFFHYIQACYTPAS